jgi:hypothetical protein
MFERLIARAEVRARRMAGRRRDQLAQRLATEAPPDVAIEAQADTVALSGRGLRRRLALDPALRWLFSGLGR